MKWFVPVCMGFCFRPPGPGPALLLVALTYVAAVRGAGQPRVGPAAGGSALPHQQAAAGPAARLQDIAPATAAAHVAAGQAQLQRRRYDRALPHFRRALRFYRTQPDPLPAAHLLLELGRLHALRGDTSLARRTYQQALAEFGRLPNTAGRARSYGALGRLYGSQQQWLRALRSYDRALAAWQQQAQPDSIAGALIHIGAAHRQLHQYSRALYYLRQALQPQPDSQQTSAALTGIAEVYQALDNQELCAHYYAQALRLLPRQLPAARRLPLLQALAAAQQALGHRPAAQRLLRQAVVVATATGSTVQLSTLYRQLAELHRRDGNYPQALAALTRAAGLRDTAYTEERAAQVAELQLRFETERKEREIQLLTKDRQIQQANLRRQTLLRNVLGAGALLLLAVAVVLYRQRRQQAHINRLLQRKNASINRQKEELSRLNRTKDTLFSIISHDLRSPLSSLYSLLSLLSIGTLPPERLAAHSNRLSRTLDSTLRLLDNLLNWSAAQMQGDGIKPEVLGLGKVVEETLTLLLGDAERKNILLLNQVPATSLVRADLNMVRLVVRNLLSNAIKFTPEGGTITVAATRPGQWWQVSVSDTGVGIAAADQAKVFGRGGPHSTLGTAHEKGTGLGLQLCKDFVERNGGQITFDSQPGVGTTFRFTLPVAREPYAKPVIEKQPSAAAESATG